MSTSTKQEPEQPKTIKSLLSGDEMKNQFALSLPKHIKPDRFVRIALTALTRTPKLAQCDQASFFGALLTLSQLGLEPDGRLAHLLPIKNTKRNCIECQLIVDYKGLVDLAMRSGNISKIHADKVCENDVFEYDRGEVIAHKIDFRNDRGKPYAYYALVVFKDGCQKANAMPKPDVDAIRRRSRAANDGPWVTDYDEMAKKTVFRQLSKWLQLSPEYRDALEADADALEERRFASATAISATLPNFSAEAGPEITTPEGGGRPGTSQAPSGTQSVPAGGSLGDGAGNATAQAAPAAPGDDLGWPPEEDAK